MGNLVLPVPVLAQSCNFVGRKAISPLSLTESTVCNLRCASFVLRAVRLHLVFNPLLCPHMRQSYAVCQLTVVRNQTSSPTQYMKGGRGWRRGIISDQSDWSYSFIDLKSTVQVSIEKSAGRVPMLLLNTEKFDWKALREARLVFLDGRVAAASQEEPLVTDLYTIKVKWSTVDLRRR